MNDRQALSVALENMRRAGGKAAKDRLVWQTLQYTVDDEIRGMGSALAKKLKSAQVERGAQKPVCGTMLAMEILAKIGMLMDEEEA